MNQYSKAGRNFLAKDTIAIQLITGFKFAEGPATNSKGEIFFADIPNNIILYWDEENGIDTFAVNTEFGNGMYFDKSDALWNCESTSRQVVRYDLTGKKDTIATHFEGKRLNKPNDIWIHPKGYIYFSDPSYFMKPEEIKQDSQMIYMYNVESESLINVSGDLMRPNGVCGNRLGKRLYIVEDATNTTWKYRIKSNGKLGKKKFFAKVGDDGLTVDKAGNVYIINKTVNSIDIFHRSGNLIQRIELPETPTNATFGGKRNNILYITTIQSLFKVEMLIKGLPKKTKSFFGIFYY